jgi:hypothetical protein
LTHPLSFDSGNLSAINRSVANPRIGGLSGLPDRLGTNAAIRLAFLSISPLDDSIKNAHQAFTIFLTIALNR